MKEPNLTLVIHGESGTGKTWLGATAPAPRLILDAEGGSTWAPGEKVRWDPKRGAPPEGVDTVLCSIKQFGDLSTVYQWLAAGKHPFRSVVLDSVTEIQKRCMDSIAGVEALDQRGWGEVLRKMESLVRSFRDLAMPNGAQGLRCVTFICGTQQKEGVYRPHVQGQLGLTLPYFVDVVGFLGVKVDEDGNLIRRLLVQPIGEHVAKDRTGRLGAWVDNPNLTEIIEKLEGK